MNEPKEIPIKETTQDPVYQEKLAKFGVTPKMARNLLIRRGFTPDFIPLLKAGGSGLGSHIDKIFAIIASGKDERLTDEIYDEIFHGEEEYEDLRKEQIRDIVQAYKKRVKREE